MPPVAELVRAPAAEPAILSGADHLRNGRLSLERAYRASGSARDAHVRTCAAYLSLVGAGGFALSDAEEREHEWLLMSLRCLVRQGGTPLQNCQAPTAGRL